MKLYRDSVCALNDTTECPPSKVATLSDLNAALAKHGMVAVPQGTAAFISTCIDAARDACGIDASDLHEMLRDAGFLESVEVKRVEDCGTGCVCAEIEEFPLQCYQLTQDAKAMIKAAEATP